MKRSSLLGIVYMMESCGLVTRELWKVLAMTQVRLW